MNIASMNSNINKLINNHSRNSNYFYKQIMNRNNLLSESKTLLEKNEKFSIPKKCKFRLSGDKVREKMIKILEDLRKEKKILDHGLEVGKELAYVLSGGNTNINKELSDEDLYSLELDSFMKLIEKNKTQERIVYTLSTGKPIIN